MLEYCFKQKTFNIIELNTQLNLFQIDEEKLQSQNPDPDLT